MQLVMARFAALFTTAPALVRCELDRARRQIALDEEAFVVGVGAYQDGQVIHRQYGVGVPREEVWAVPDSEAVVLHAGALALGQALEDTAQPFRFRQWLFAQVGEVDEPVRVRERLYEELPEYLQRWVRGASLAEVAFGILLDELRGIGRLEDSSLEAPVVAEMLIKAARAIERASAAEGGTHRARQALVATNGLVLAGVRQGGHPLAYLPLEGQATCTRCSESGERAELESRAREHLRRRSVILATDPLRAEAWASVPEGGGVAVDRTLTVTLVPRAD
jgi:hypothetical protein